MTRMYDVPDNVLWKWSAAVKLSAMATKYYQHDQSWVPKPGDVWCLSRDDLELWQCLASGDRIEFIKIFDAYGDRVTGQGSLSCSRDEFLNGGFSSVRVPIPRFAWDKGVKWYPPEQVSWEISDYDVWWWNDGEQSVHVIIMYSPTTGKFFAPLGQWGWGRAQDLIEMGGLWSPCARPNDPPTENPCW